MPEKPDKKLPLEFTEIILDSVSDGVFTVDENMKVTYFNRAAEKITGVSKDEAIGRSCYNVFRSNICEKNCIYNCAFESGTEIIDKHVNILRTDGKVIPVSVSTAVLKDVNGKTIGGVETFRDLSSFEELQKEIKSKYTLEDIVSKNHKIHQIFEILPNVAESESTVLIQGASGSGKELFARAVHNLSHRKKGPFVAINCGAIPDTLLESELFGYVKGAFTDAKKDKPGQIALAKGGTIFFDEIESMSPSTQVKLLRVLQERKYTPLGATEAIDADVRVISATKDDLIELVNIGQFRDDLYFRLKVVKLQLPALKERRDDIPLLVEKFVEKFNRKMHRNIHGVADAVLALLMQYDFPGNVRELENIIEHAFVMCRASEIQLSHLPPELIQYSENRGKDRSDSLQTAEKQTLLKILEKHGGNKLAVAGELGVHRATLYRKLRKHNLL